MAGLSPFTLTAASLTLVLGLTVLARFKPIPILALFLGVYSLSYGIQPAPLKQGFAILGLAIYPMDVISAILLISSVIWTKSDKVKHLTLYVGFAGLLLCSLARGIHQFGLQVSTNEARRWVYLAVGIVFVATRIAKKDINAVLRMLTLLGVFLTLYVWTTWATRGVGGSTITAIVDGVGVDSRPLTGQGSILLTQTFIVALCSARTPMRRMAIAIIAMATIILLQQRTTWIATAIAIVVSYVSWAARKPKQESMSIIIRGASGTVIFAIAAILSLKSTSIQASLSSAQGPKSNSAWRVTSWQELVTQDSSWLNHLIGRPFGTGFMREVGNIRWHVQPHNFYVETYLRVGVLGVLLLIAILAWCALRLTSNKNVDNLPHWAWIGLFCLLVVGGISYTLEAPQGIIFGLLLVVLNEGDCRDTTTEMRDNEQSGRARHSVHDLSQPTGNDHRLPQSPQG